MPGHSEKHEETHREGGDDNDGDPHDSTIDRDVGYLWGTRVHLYYYFDQREQ